MGSRVDAGQAGARTLRRGRQRRASPAAGPQAAARVPVSRVHARAVGADSIRSRSGACSRGGWPKITRQNSCAPPWPRSLARTAARLLTGRYPANAPAILRDVAHGPLGRSRPVDSALRASAESRALRAAPGDERACLPPVWSGCRRRRATRQQQQLGAGRPQDESGPADSRQRSASADRVPLGVVRDAPRRRRSRCRSA